MKLLVVVNQLTSNDLQGLYIINNENDVYSSKLIMIIMITVTAVIK